MDGVTDARHKIDNTENGIQAFVRETGKGDAQIPQRSLGRRGGTGMGFLVPNPMPQEDLQVNK